MSDIRPEYYQSYSEETIDMMVAIFGSVAVADFCLINAFKYRMRMGNKEGQSFEDDLSKERWYLKKSKELLK